MEPAEPRGREGRCLAVLEAEQRTRGCWYKIQGTKIHLERWGGARALAALRKPLRGVAVPHGSPTAACPPEAGQHQSRLLSDLGKKQSTCAKNDLSNKQSIACYGEDGGGRLFCSSVMGESWTVTEGHNERLPAWSRIQGCVSSCPGPGARWWGPPRSLIPPVEPLWRRAQLPPATGKCAAHQVSWL